MERIKSSTIDFRSHIIPNKIYQVLQHYVACAISALTYSKIDRLGLDYISQEEFRAAVESRFDLEISEDQFRAFLDRVPLDHDGNVKYAEFMAQFDTR